jgi:hypothetical protein
VSDDDYRRALAAAAKEYEQLGAERQRIDRRLGELAHTISTLSRLCGITSTVVWGLSDACRTVVRNAGVPLTVPEIHDRLGQIGVDLSTYSNSLAVVHTTVRRLHEASELRMVAGLGKTAYIWNSPPRAASLGPDAAQAVRKIEQKKTTRKREKK